MLEGPRRAGDFIRHAAEKLAAIGKLELLSRFLPFGESCHRDDACDRRGTLEHWRRVRSVSGTCAVASSQQLMASSSTINPCWGLYPIAKYTGTRERPSSRLACAHSRT